MYQSQASESYQFLIKIWHISRYPIPDTKSMKYCNEMSDLHPWYVLDMCSCYSSCFLMFWFHSTAVPLAGDDSGLCLAIVKGEDCRNSALPFTRHCFQRILSKFLFFELVRTTQMKLWNNSRLLLAVRLHSEWFFLWLQQTICFGDWLKFYAFLVLCP